MNQIFHRLSRRPGDRKTADVNFDEERGSVCTAACRTDGRLEEYHFEAQYLTRIFR